MIRMLGRHRAVAMPMELPRKRTRLTRNRISAGIRIKAKIRSKKHLAAILATYGTTITTKKMVRLVRARTMVLDSEVW
jgi:hypothetical protein